MIINQVIIHKAIQLLLMDLMHLKNGICDVKNKTIIYFNYSYDKFYLKNSLL